MAFMARGKRVLMPDEIMEDRLERNILDGESSDAVSDQPPRKKSNHKEKKRKRRNGYILGYIFIPWKTAITCHGGSYKHLHLPTLMIRNGSGEFVA